MKGSWRHLVKPKNLRGMQDSISLRPCWTYQKMSVKSFANTTRIKVIGHKKVPPHYLRWASNGAELVKSSPGPQGAELDVYERSEERRGGKEGRSRRARGGG